MLVDRADVQAKRLCDFLGREHGLGHSNSGVCLCLIILYHILNYNIFLLTTARRSGQSSPVCEVDDRPTHAVSAVFVDRPSNSGACLPRCLVNGVRAVSRHGRIFCRPALRQILTGIAFCRRQNESPTEAVAQLREAWEGLVAGKREDTADLSLVAVLKPNDRGSSGVFLGLVDDGQRYYIKPSNNLQNERVPVTEQIVGRTGAIIGAPVCTVKTVMISQEFEGTQYCHSRALVPGIAHASLAVDNSIESSRLSHRLDNENVIRHTFIMALHDWCWGSDNQWLVSLVEDRAYYSHDHGNFLPPGGASWFLDSLLQNIHVPHELSDLGRNITPSAASHVAKSLQSIERDQICGALVGIPASWSVSNVELEAVGVFLEYRAPEVADRLARRFMVS